MQPFIINNIVYKAVNEYICKRKLKSEVEGAGGSLIFLNKLDL